jgi:predicted PolB exonuclease-like 3'-5' exonuclease
MNVLAFDIETIPDLDSGRRLYQLDGLDDADVARAMFQLRRQKTGGSDFLPPHLHRVVAISVAMARGDEFRVWSLGDPAAGERELVERFFDGIDRFGPNLVSWNGGGFDLPVLHYRALLHGVAATRYWETGDGEREFKWNNYLSRYHWRHIDLMDVLAGYQMRAVAPLDEVAVMLGLPGKLGMHGSKVFDAWLAGDIDAIRDYCETDALNTFLIYLRFELLRGRLTPAEYERRRRQIRAALLDDGRGHLNQFVEAWKAEDAA